MANEEHLEILKKGVDVWNQWRKEYHQVRPDLSDTNLSDTNLSYANLHDVDLIRVNFFLANLSYADLSYAELYRVQLTDANLIRANLKMAQLLSADLLRANLSYANLHEADLTGVNLRSADLLGVDLQRADLSFANLNSTNIRDANFHECILRGSTISNVDLSEAKGFETIRNFGPSTIGIDTIYKSHGAIPEVFLRGAGVPEKFIEYIPSIVTGEAIQFYSCFISYSTRDQEFAETLHADLQSKGVRCWFAPEDIKGGRKLHEQIPEAIRLHDKMLIVLSENSMKSEWVKTEIYNARQDEIRNNKRKLFPIGLVDFSTIREWEAFDADVGKDMAREIREYFIPDFSNWKNHDEYKKAFDRLLRDLGTEELPQL